MSSRRTTVGNRHTLLQSKLSLRYWCHFGPIGEIHGLHICKPWAKSSSHLRILPFNRLSLRKLPSTVRVSVRRPSVCHQQTDQEFRFTVSWFRSTVSPLCTVLSVLAGKDVVTGASVPTCRIVSPWKWLEAAGAGDVLRPWSCLRPVAISFQNPVLTICNST